MPEARQALLVMSTGFLGLPMSHPAHDMSLLEEVFHSRKQMHVVAIA